MQTLYNYFTFVDNSKAVFCFICLMASVWLNAQTTSLLYEDFSNCAITSSWDWEIRTDNDSSYFYQIGQYISTTGFAPNSSIDSTCHFYFDDDALGENGAPWSAQLISPTFDPAFYTSVNLDLDVFFRNFDGSDYLSIQVFDGLNYIELERFQDQDYAGITFDQAVHRTYDLSPYANCDMHLLFEYNDGGGWGWYCGFDNISVTASGANTQTLHSYDFECDADGWASNNLIGTQGWTFGTAAHINGSCNANIVDNGDANNIIQSQLISPNINGVGIGRLLLVYQFDFSQTNNIAASNFYNYSYLKSSIVSNGDTTMLTAYQGKNWNNQIDTFDISAYKSPNMQIIFEYGDNEAAQGGWAALDNVQILGLGNASNEICNNALPLVLDAPCQMACNIGAYFDGPVPSCNELNTSGVWFAFTPGAIGTNTININIESNFNDVLSVYTGNCNALSPVACSNQDAFGFGGEQVSLSNLNASSTYYVRVSGADCTFGKSEGIFCIEATTNNAPTTAPSNNNCLGATTLIANDPCINGSNLQASFSNLVPSCNEYATDDIWYHFVPTTSDSLLITTESEFAEVITLYEGSCGALTEVACADYGHELSIANLSIGNNYYIQVSAAFASLRGNVCMRLQQTSTGIVYGCTDPSATNYNPQATVDDGSCISNGFPWPYQISPSSHTIILTNNILSDLDGTSLQIGDYVGAFYNDNGTMKCAGYIEWQGIQTGFLVYGNDGTEAGKNGFDTDEPMEIRVWQTSSNTEWIMNDVVWLPPYSLNGVVSHMEQFANNGISAIGEMNTQAVCNKNIPVPLGWSMLSSNCYPNEPAMDIVWSDIALDIVQIKDLSNFYIPPININNLGNWESEKGYYVKANQAVNLNIDGIPIDPLTTPIPLNEGWNLIPYLLEQAADPSNVFASILSDVVQVKNLTGTYLPSLGINQLGTMQVNQAYLVKVCCNTSLTYDPSMALRPSSVNTAMLSEYFGQASITPSTSTLVFLENADWNEGDEFGIYNQSGILVGSGVYQNQNLAILVYGNDASTNEVDGLFAQEAYQIKYWHKGSNTSTTLEYELIEGHSYFVENDLVLIAGKTHTATNSLSTHNHQLQFWPNPASEQLNLNIHLSNAQDINIQLYDTNGKLVKELYRDWLDTQNQNLSFDLKDIQAGMYFYEVIGDTWIQTGKINIY